MAKINPNAGNKGIKTPTDMKTGRHLPSGIASPASKPQVGGVADGQPGSKQ